MVDQVVKKAHRIAHLEIYEVSEDELDTIERGYSSRQNDVAFLSIAATIFVSFLVVILTVPRPAAPTFRDQFFVAVLVMSGSAAVYLFIRWRRTIKSERPLFQRIRERAVGPLGEEGMEFKPSELEKLTPETPGEPEGKRG
jgi:hypothetical protein